jgi:hypothetical protein
MDVGAAIAIGAVVGVVCGLAPLIYGLNRNEKGLAWGGFGACVAGGALLGLLLAIPMAILFSILIHNAAKRKDRGYAAPATNAYGAPTAQTGMPAGGPESPQATGWQAPTAR